jgi:hypothetical protein
LQPDLKIADTIRSTLRASLGATIYEVIALHIQSRTGIDFSHPETVVGNVRVLEDSLHQTFKDSAAPLMEKAGNKLLAAFSLPNDYNNNNFQYSQTGDLSTLVEKILKRNDPIAILHNARDRDHFTMSYTRKDEFPTLLVTFLQRGVQNNCLNVLVISEDEKRLFESFLNSSEGHHYYGKSTMGFSDDDSIVIVTHDELYGDIDSFSSSSLSSQPIVDSLNRVKQRAIQKQMSGLNIVGTFAGRLFSKGRFEECLQIENLWHHTIQQFSMPITVMCPYEKPIDEPHRTPLAICHNGGLHQI